MEFIITRTTDWLSEDKPCEKAELIKNEKYYKEWKIEINNLEELIQIMKNVDEPLIIRENFYILKNENTEHGIELEIEIYDDYRE